MRVLRLGQITWSGRRPSVAHTVLCPERLYHITARLEQLLTSHASASESMFVLCAHPSVARFNARTTGALEKKSARVVVVFVGIPGTRLTVESHAYSRSIMVLRVSAKKMQRVW